MYHRNEFSTLDYVIFAATLLVSLSIGIYNAFKNRNKQSTKEILLAGGNMGVLPVALSLFASFMSSIAIIGVPAEVYVYDTMFMWSVVSFPIAIFLSAHVHIPIFYNLKLTSAYEYLELRFSRSVRILVTICFCMYMIMYMSIVLYAPALAFNAVTGFSLWGAILSVGTVCTVYTAIGGMKAVLWTDCFQAVLMFIGVIVTLIWGSIKAGGMSEVWRIAGEHERIKFIDFSFDHSTRYTVWTGVFGQAMMWTTLFGTNQAQIQRTLTCATLKNAQKALWFCMPGLVIIITMGCLNGLVAFAYYQTCDPLSAGIIKAGDQLLPLFVMEIMGSIPGLPGIFIAAVFSGSLSTVSSGLNSMSAVLLQDIVKPFIAPTISDKKAANVSKIMALVLGIVCLLFSYVASKLGSVVKAALSMFGIMGSPVHGVITLGMIFPWANAKGAFAGTITSMGIMMWIGIGSFMYKVYPMSPMSTEGCPNNTTGIWNNSSTFSSIAMTTIPTQSESNTIFPLYDLSYTYYMLLSPAIVLVVGLAVSFLTGHNDPKSVDPRLICPIFDVLCPYLPEKIRKPLRFGIIHKDKYKIQSKMAQMITEAQLITLNPDDVQDQQEREMFIDVKPSDTSETLMNGAKQHIN
ncbi:sodium-dependent multivitamin transporter-like [Mytilus galloprovincialis]|uniref:sodium-dependent multivitamin transporter-like n=1 Tax=Mytilus galloprovincialis TaxID=29158 RepID=UPI003F7BB674